MSRAQLKPILLLSLLAILTIPIASCSRGGDVPKTGNLALFGTLSSTEFFHTGTCTACHAELHNQWSGSMHNNSYRDPLYRKVYELAVKDTEGDKTIEAFCVSCHSPLGFLSGEVPSDGRIALSKIAENGIQCDFCHTVSGARGIGDFAVESAPGKVKRGPLKDAASPQHETAYSELHTKSEFCGMCHNVSHPVNRLPLENTYTEWKDSPYSAEGIQCQDCHMTPGPGVTKPNPGKASVMGPDRPHIYTHSIVGGNVAIAGLLGSDDHAALAEERLKGAASVAILAPGTINAGASNTIKVKVTNTGAGHYLPTGLTETREMWLYVNVKDGAGKTVFSSGDVDIDGRIAKNTVLFNTVVGDENGKPTHKVWRATKILSDRRIPPKESLTELYAVDVPASATGPYTVEAVLKYRSAPQELVDELLGEDAFQLPITDMARALLKVE